MKHIIKPIRIMLNLKVLLLLSLIGCASLRRDVSKPPSGKGFGVVVYWHGIIHRYHITEIHYWDARGRDTVMWRHATFQEFFDDEKDLALFHGWLNKSASPWDERQVSRFYAANGPEPVADITDELILRYAKEQGKDIREALKTHAIGQVRKEAGRYLIHVDDLGQNQEGTVALALEELLEMIREGRKKGRMLKDPGDGTPYYKRDVLADLPKDRGDEH